MYVLRVIIILTLLCAWFLICTVPGCFFDPISYTVNEADGVVEVTVRNNQPNNAAFQSGACCLVTELLASEASGTNA